MIVNIHHIPESGLKLEMAMPSESLGVCDGKRTFKSSPAICQLKAQMSADNLIVRGDATVVLECLCDRCLNKTSVTVDAEDICVVIENCPDIVDLTNYIREDILLAFPQIYLCQEDCKGLCFNCGKDLNNELCECNSDQADESPWGALDNLKFNDTTGD